MASAGDTPLHLVVTSQCLRGARLLVKAGARIDITNQKGLSPLTKAELKHETKIATYFRQHLGNG
jgi:hypothetical protein